MAGNVTFEARRVGRWIEAEDVGRLAGFLMSGTHHRKPGVPAKIKLQVVGAISQACSPEERVAWADRLMAREEPIARSIACGLVASGWTLDRKQTLSRMQSLAEDPDWEVREWAADLFAGILALDFEEGLCLYRKWAEDGSEELRRAIALGLGFRTKASVAVETKPMLAIMANLMTKPGAYLQKNLGPFALGGAFLGRCPDETLALCRRLVRKKDENTRWNIAMAFTSARARKHAQAGNAILDQLESDERARIVRAVAKARRNLAKA